MPQFFVPVHTGNRDALCPLSYPTPREPTSLLSLLSRKAEDRTTLITAHKTVISKQASGIFFFSKVKKFIFLTSGSGHECLKLPWLPHDGGDVATEVVTEE